MGKMQIYFPCMFNVCWSCRHHFAYVGSYVSIYADSCVAMCLGRIYLCVQVLDRFSNFLSVCSMKSLSFAVISMLSNQSVHLSNTISIN